MNATSTFKVHQGSDKSIGARAVAALFLRHRAAKREEALRAPRVDVPAQLGLAPVAAGVLQLVAGVVVAGAPALNISADALGALLGVCGRTVRRGTAQLVALGLVVKVPQYDDAEWTCGRGLRWSRRRRWNVYTLTPAARAALALPASASSCEEPVINLSTSSTCPSNVASESLSASGSEVSESESGSSRGEESPSRTPSTRSFPAAVPASSLATPTGAGAGAAASGTGARGFKGYGKSRKISGRLPEAVASLDQLAQARRFALLEGVRVGAWSAAVAGVLIAQLFPSVAEDA